MPPAGGDAAGAPAGLLGASPDDPERTSAAGSAGGATGAPPGISRPRRSAVGSADTGVRASRGCAPRRWPSRTRCGATAQRRSPGTKVWSGCPRGLGGVREHPGQDHSGSGAVNGQRHSPGIRVCSLRARCIRPRHPGHLLPSTSGSGTSTTRSSGPTAASGYAKRSCNRAHSTESATAKDQGSEVRGLRPDAI